MTQVRVKGDQLGEPTDQFGNHHVQLRVESNDIDFDQRTPVLVNKRSGTVFIQTDKTIYSPGQTGTVLNPCVRVCVYKGLFVGVLLQSNSISVISWW